MEGGDKKRKGGTKEGEEPTTTLIGLEYKKNKEITTSTLRFSYTGGKAFHSHQGTTSMKCHLHVKHVLIRTLYSGAAPVFPPLLIYHSIHRANIFLKKG